MPERKPKCSQASASPWRKRIALSLNAEGVTGPRGGFWTPSALNGNRANGTGILNNELYIGRLAWNRRRWIKDPTTGRRIARANDESQLVVQEVPELRIVTNEVWDAHALHIAPNRCIRR